MSHKIKELFTFIENSPSPFHVVDNIKKELRSCGFLERKENQPWELEQGGKYFVTRNDSSILAFTLPKSEIQSMKIVASHSDSPTFRIKEYPEIHVKNQYTKLNVEPYGGMIKDTWFDRPLSVAGRIFKRENQRIVSQLVDVNRDLLMIPNLAIHMNRNQEGSINPQVDLLPLYSSQEKDFMECIAKEANVKKEDILGSDLFLYNRMKPTTYGYENELIAAPKLDDLECAFASVEGIKQSENEYDMNICCVFDNEEVGSGTKQGAMSTFLQDTILRIFDVLGSRKEAFLMAVANSFMISADNAHALHPNKQEKSDPTHEVYLNKGVVIKFSANQKYTTDGSSAAIFKDLCQKANVPYQIFHNRSDMAGGSTLGNLLNHTVSLKSVDVGLPQLAMHSSYETAGSRDLDSFIKVLKLFYQG